MNPIPKRIEDQLITALDSLGLCVEVCKFLQECHGSNIPTQVQMIGTQRTVLIPGENSGFVTTPVIHAAILDIRRLLPFLGLGYDTKLNRIDYNKTLRPDDYCIKDLNLDYVTPINFNTLAAEVCGMRSSMVLREPLIYLNKQVAHFSKVEMLPKFGDLIESCRLLSEAVFKFVYESLGLPRPHSHFVQRES